MQPRVPVLLVAAVIAGLLFLVTRAHSHSWYSDTGCCYGDGDSKDCDPAPDGSVIETKNGWIVTLTKAEMLSIRPSLRDSSDFKALEWGISEFVPMLEAKPSQDGGYHVCLRAGPVSPASMSSLTQKSNGPVSWILCFFNPLNS